MCTQVSRIQRPFVYSSIVNSAIVISPPTTMLFDRCHRHRCDYFRKIATAFFLTLRILTPFVYTYSYRQSYTDSRSKPSKEHHSFVRSSSVTKRVIDTVFTTFCLPFVVGGKLRAKMLFTCKQTSKQIHCGGP